MSDVEIDEDEAFVDELKPGTELRQGQFIVEKFINAGGFGITYLATDTGLGRKVVIKECFPSSFCHRSRAIVQARSRAHTEELKSVVDLFVQEARSLSKMDHPNIVGVHQIFEENETAYMVLDFVEGQDLLDIIEESTRTLSSDEIVKVLSDVLAAVGYIHKQDILHRDISPDNILLDANLKPILIDFGAAREEATKKSRVLSALRVVKDGYSPQEFYVQGSEQNPSSDLYALGATFYHLIHGDLPPNSQARLAAIAGAEPDPYEKLAGRFDQYDPKLLLSIDRALAILPKDRIQSAEEWQAILDGTIAGDQPAPVAAAAPVAANATAAPSSSSGSKKTVLLGTAAALALMAVGGLFAMGAFDGSQEAADIQEPSSEELEAASSNRAVEAQSEAEDRLASSQQAQAEQARLASEAAAKAEEERLARLSAERVEAEEARLAAETAAAAEAERLAQIAAERAKAEEDRLAAETEAAEEAGRLAQLAAQRAQAEADRLAAETAAAAEADRLAQVAAERAKAEEARLAAETAAEAEADRLERIAAERIKAEEERLAAEVAAEKQAEELAKIEKAMRAAEQARIEAEQAAAAQAKQLAEIEAARAQAEAERLAAEQAAERARHEAKLAVLRRNRPQPRDDGASAAFFSSPDAPFALVNLNPMQTVSVDQESAELTFAEIKDPQPVRFDLTLPATGDAEQATVLDVTVPVAPVATVTPSAEGEADILSAWSVELPFSGQNDSRIISETAIVAPAWARVGVEIIGVNGKKIRRMSDINTVLRNSGAPVDAALQPVTFMIKRPGSDAIVEQPWQLPIVQETVLLNGLGFTTRFTGEDWQTVVSNVPDGISELEVGDEIVANMMTSQQLTTRTALPDVIRSGLEQGVSQFSFAVLRKGSMWVASMTYAGGA